MISLISGSVDILNITLIVFYFFSITNKKNIKEWSQKYIYFAYW